MSKNIRLSFIVFPLANAYFWFGIWVLYYLKFTNYAGIGIIAALGMITSVILEIPTGALADLMGKKKVLQMAFVCFAIGGFITASAQNFMHIIIATVIGAAGGALASGTGEAFFYDSLKQDGKENTYDNLLAKLNKYSLIIMAIASVSGGFLYKFDPRSPFLLTSLTALAALVVSRFFIEPKVNTIKFSLKNYLNQNKEGLRQLFQGQSVYPVLKMLVVTSFIYFIAYGLDVPLAIGFGFKEEWLGTIFAVGIIAAAVGNHFYPRLKETLGKDGLLMFIFISTFLTVIFSPIIGLTLGGLALVYRHFLYNIPDIIASDTINRFVDSKYRATTLSSFVFLHNLPYLLSAYFVGKMIDHSSTGITTMWVSIAFALLVMLIIILNKYYKQLKAPE